MRMVDKEYALVCDDGGWSPFIVSLDLAEEVHQARYPTRPRWKYETISLWWLIEAEEVVDSYWYGRGWWTKAFMPVWDQDAELHRVP